MNIFAAFVAFDLIATLIEAGVETIEREGEGFVAWFADGAVAGDEGVIVEAIVEAVVDGLELVIDDGE